MAWEWVRSGGLSLSALLLMGALAGCGGDDSKGGEHDTKHPDRGDLRFSFDDAPPEFAAVARELSRSGAFDDLAEGFNATFKLPRDLPVEHVACGEPNAFYVPSERKLYMCYELLQKLSEVSQALSLSDDERETLVGGTWVFVLFHELGHALIDYYDLPVTGREEDAVDDFSSVLMIESGNAEYALAAAQFFGASDSGMYDELSFADEHSLNAQRLYSILCTVYGSNPRQYAELVTSGVLPESRAQGCPAEYAQKSESWETLLEPWTK